MKTYRYNRLVLDKAEDFLSKEGVCSKPITISGDRYVQAVLTKIRDEHSEVKNNGTRESVIRELASIEGLLISLYEKADINRNEVLSYLQEKDAEQGSFRDGVFYEDVQVEPGSAADKYLSDCGFEVISE